ncbi:hypothetical protein EX86_14990, partial [Staphylococcus aureus]|uniref:hypothetical protein n=1 Tax=Staphylococcus aureus TaxID=1280 RepID=UPI00065C002A
IDNLTHFNTQKKTAFIQKVNTDYRGQAETDLQNSATSPNNAMDQLTQSIPDDETIVASDNYTNASPDTKGAYSDAYNDSKL